MMIRRVARPMLAAAFISQGVDAIRRPRTAADTARPTLEGLRKLPDPVGSKLPTDPDVFAKATAAAQIGGGLLLATGRLPRLASAALAATVIPANLGAHMFWDEPDPVGKARKRRDFMVDLSLVGGLMIASADTAGKPSIGWRGRRAARRVSEAVGLTAAGADGLTDRVSHGLHTGAEMVGHQLHTGAERVGHLLEVAGERSGPVVESAREHVGTALEAVRERASEAKSEAKRLARH